MSDFTVLSDALMAIRAEHETPDNEIDSMFRLQISGGDAPKKTARAIVLHSTWFYFDKHGSFRGYGYAGYDELEHFVARVKRQKVKGVGK